MGTRRNTSTISVAKLEGKRTLGRSKRDCKIIFKFILRNICKKLSPKFN
jgi:hypothetical protein